MKYMLLIYHNPDTPFSKEEMQEVFGEVDAIMRELGETGEWAGGEGLAPPERTRTVRVRGGVPAVTDGPYLEAKEYLAGYCIFDCESEERAIELAARWPDARRTGVELRPLVTGPPEA